eukprot:675055-Hanusia_phi.AAC.1
MLTQTLTIKPRRTGYAGSGHSSQGLGRGRRPPPGDHLPGNPTAPCTEFKFRAGARKSYRSTTRGYG